MNLSAYLMARGRRTRDQNPPVRTPWLLLGGSLAAVICLQLRPPPPDEVTAVLGPFFVLVFVGSLALTAILRLIAR